MVSLLEVGWGSGTLVGQGGWAALVEKGCWAGLVVQGGFGIKWLSSPVGSTPGSGQGCQGALVVAG